MAAFFFFHKISHRDILQEKETYMFFDSKKLWKLKKALLSLSQTGTADGVTLITEKDVLEVGDEVFIDGEDGLEPAHDKTYTAGDNLITVEGGKVTAIVEKPIEQPVEEPAEEPVVEEPVVEEPVVEEPVVEEPVVEEPVVEEPAEEPVVEEPVEEPAEEEISKDELQAIIDEQKAVIEQLKAENEELKAKLEEPMARSAEEAFKNEKPNENNEKVDFSKYIRKQNKH